MSSSEARLSYVIEPLSNSHDRTEFNCGIDSLTRYLQKQANQDKKRRIAVPYVICKVDDPRVLGYFTLSTYSVGGPEFPDEITKRFPKYDTIPAILLGRLAVDHSLHGQGMGGVLLIDAMVKSFQASQRVAAFAVVVDAINESARDFYIHFGFIPFANHRDKLFLPMKTIEQLVKEQGLPT